MLFEGNVAKGVLSPERFSELVRAGKIEYPTITDKEIEDRSKADGFSKNGRHHPNIVVRRAVCREKISASRHRVNVPFIGCSYYSDVLSMVG